MGVVDTLVTEYKMNNRDYVAGGNQVVATTGQMGGAITRATGLLTAFATAVGTAGALLIGFSVASSKKAAEFDAMVKALEAVVGSAEDAKKALEELHKIAAMPGLGLEEALKGYTALRRAGMDDSMAMRTISSAGNANALASGGRAELEQILRAISQIAMKPNLSGEELMQLNEAGVPASKIIGEKFGTFDGGELKKLGVDSQMALEALVEGLEKMPKAAGSAKNSIENLGMAIDMAMVGFGTALNSSFVPTIENITKALEGVSDKGLFEAVGSTLATLAEVTFPELSTSSEELELVIVDVAAAILDAVQAFTTLKFVVEEIVKIAEELPSRKIEKWIRSFFEDDKVGSAGDQSKAEYEQKNFVPIDGIPPEVLERRKGREAEKRAADEAKAKLKAEEDAKKAAEKEAKTTAEKTASYMKEQLDWARRAALAGEQLVELSKSTIGGSSYGDMALSAVSMGGNMQAMIHRAVDSYFGGIAIKHYGQMQRRR